MVVDDNKLNVDIINLMLKKTGAVTETAFNGEEALNLFTSSETNHFDMILLDIQMPVMDGLECAKKIRASGREDSNLPILAISANAFPEDREKSLQSGMNEHLSKPVIMAKLFSEMKKYF